MHAVSVSTMMFHISFLITEYQRRNQKNQKGAPVFPHLLPGNSSTFPNPKQKKKKKKKSDGKHVKLRIMSGYNYQEDEGSSREDLVGSPSPLPPPREGVESPVRTKVCGGCSLTPAHTQRGYAWRVL